MFKGKMDLDTHSSDALAQQEELRELDYFKGPRNIRRIYGQSLHVSN